MKSSLLALLFASCVGVSASGPTETPIFHGAFAKYCPEVPTKQAWTSAADCPTPEELAACAAYNGVTYEFSRFYPGVQPDAAVCIYLER